MIINLNRFIITLKKKLLIILNLAIKELIRISFILSINYLSFSNPNHHLDLIKSSYHNYKKIFYFKFNHLRDSSYLFNSFNK